MPVTCSTSCPRCDPSALLDLARLLTCRSRVERLFRKSPRLGQAHADSSNKGKATSDQALTLRTGFGRYTGLPQARSLLERRSRSNVPVPLRPFVSQLTTCRRIKMHRLLISTVVSLAWVVPAMAQ